jgi:putative endonuclease
MQSKQIGVLGERIASDFLKKKNYQILDRNYSSKKISGPIRGEIDIIAKEKDTLHFVEVKTLTSDKIISPEEKIDFQKEKKIIKMAEYWLLENKISFDTKWQIDVISVIINLNSKKAKIRHFENAIF